MNIFMLFQMEKLGVRRPLSSKRSPRSVSPNNVVINGQIIDKKSSENIIGSKKMLLDNISEESDVLLFEGTENGPLEDAVRRADENVQRFINEMSNSSGIRENDAEFESICKNSQDELRGLSNFLSTIDENSKSRIISTLLKVYKNEIASGIKGTTLPSLEPEDKVSKFKNVCKDLISEYRMKPSHVPNAPEVSIPDDIKFNSENMEKKADVSAQYDRIDIIAGKLAEKNQQPITDETVSSTSPDSERNDPLNLHTNFTINYQTRNELAKDYEKFKVYNPFTAPSAAETYNRLQTSFLTDSLSNGDSLKKPVTRFDAKKTFTNLPLEIRSSTERAIDKILGRELKGPIAQTEYSLKRKISAAKGLNKTKSVTFYQSTRKLLEDPQFSDINQFISQGVQASLPSTKKKRKARKHFKSNKVDFIKPFRYLYESSYESRSDIALGCPHVCPLTLKNSKSDTDMPHLKARRRFGKKKGRKHQQPTDKNDITNSLIQVQKKCSLELIRAKDLRRKNQLISYLDKGLRRGDSELHFSQILFETANKNVDNDMSAFEIPSLEMKNVDNFNANYLLHTLKLTKRSKAEILPKNPLKHFGNGFSEVSITEEDYKTWLEKQNWLKYSNTAHELQSFQNLRSISETVAAKMKDRCGEYGYYLDRGDYTSASSASHQTVTLLGEFRDLFLYEQIVISRAINFFLTFNAKRTRRLNMWDRGVQVLFFLAFYATWFYFSEYVFVEPASGKRSLFWK